jgi:hypothetical protein
LELSVGDALVVPALPSVLLVAPPRGATSPPEGAIPVVREVELLSGTGVVPEPESGVDELAEVDDVTDESVELVVPPTEGWLPKPSIAVPAATEGFAPCAAGCAEPCASAAVDSVPIVAIIRYR